MAAESTTRKRASEKKPDAAEVVPAAKYPKQASSNSGTPVASWKAPDDTTVDCWEPMAQLMSYAPRLYERSIFKFLNIAGASIHTASRNVIPLTGQRPLASLFGEQAAWALCINKQQSESASRLAGLGAIESARWQERELQGDVGTCKLCQKSDRVGTL